MPTAQKQAQAAIDQLLTAAGLSVQDYQLLCLHTARRAALPELDLTPCLGTASYLLCRGGQFAGLIQDQKVGATLTGVGIQSARCAKDSPARFCPLPFLRESNGAEIDHPNVLDPGACAYTVFIFRRPKPLADWRSCRRLAFQDFAAPTQ